MLRVRVTDEMLEKLDYLSKENNKSRSEVVRNLIEDEYNRQKK